jgi:hypothetical protein
MKLTNLQFENIKKELSIAKLVTKDEFDRRVELNAAWKRIDEGSDYSTMKVTHYDISNIKLIEMLNELCGGKTENVTSLHVVEYYEGNFLRSHVDSSSRLTLNLLIESECEGGDLYIEGNRADLNEAGDYVIYDGGIQQHEVKPIIKGYRKTLIIWYSIPYVDKNKLI